MVKIDALKELETADISSELKAFLSDKFKAIISQYQLDDISGLFSIMILSDNEIDHIKDRMFEFFDVMIMDGKKLLHAVCVPSDNYSEDIYIPYSSDNEVIIKERCS